MKLSVHQMAKLNKEFNVLKKKDKVISISEVKKKIDEIIDLTEKLEDLLSEQMDAIEVFVNDCKEDACECEDEIKQSELYEFYSDIEDRVLGGNLYRAIRMIS